MLDCFHRSHCINYDPGSELFSRVIPTSYYPRESWVKTRRRHVRAWFPTVSRSAVRHIRTSFLTATTLAEQPPPPRSNEDLSELCRRVVLLSRSRRVRGSAERARSRVGTYAKAKSWRHCIDICLKLCPCKFAHGIRFERFTVLFSPPPPPPPY